MPRTSRRNRRFDPFLGAIVLPSLQQSQNDRRFSAKGLTCTQGHTRRRSVTGGKGYRKANCRLPQRAKLWRLGLYQTRRIQRYSKVTRTPVEEHSLGGLRVIRIERIGSASLAAHPMLRY